MLKKIQSSVVVLLYGIPGSGKSTQAKLLEKIMKFQVFESDNYLEYDIKNIDVSYTLAIKKMLKYASIAHNHSSPIVICGAFASPQKWKILQDWEKTLKSPIIKLFLDCSVDTALKRISTRKNPGIDIHSKARVNHLMLLLKKENFARQYHRITAEQKIQAVFHEIVILLNQL